MLGPLPYWLLGVLCLAIVWVTALLCAYASLSYASGLGARARALGATLREGRVVRGLGATDGADRGAFAAHVVEQVGRALDGEPPALAFSDKAYRGEVFGGTLECGGATLDLGASSAVEVWPDAARQAAAAGVEGDAAFDALYKDARGAKGSPRLVTTWIGEGDTVHFATDAAGALTFLAASSPLAFFAARRRAHVLFALAELGVCAGLTALALRPPAFGPLSTLGGVALLAFFLLVQPVGVAVEEASREPWKAFLRGTHRRSAPFPGGVVPGRTTTQVLNG